MKTLNIAIPVLMAAAQLNAWPDRTVACGICGTRKRGNTSRRPRSRRGPVSGQGDGSVSFLPVRLRRLSLAGTISRARIDVQSGDEDSLPPMDEACSANPHSGLTCIKCAFKSKGANWAAVLPERRIALERREPGIKLGDVPNAGVDLQGSTRLTFWARGEKVASA